MKILFVAVGVFVLLGVAYGLAFMGVIPVKAIAKQSPAAAKLLTAMNLYHAPAPAAKTKVAVAPPPDPVAAAQAQIEVERAQIAREKAALASQAKDPVAVSSAPSPKLIAIYDTMASEDLVRIFAKQPDSAVVAALNGMDERRAGKVLALLDPARASKVTALMSRTTASPPSGQLSAGSSPATSLP